MTWLHFGFILFGAYAIWFIYLLRKKRSTRPLLWFGIAHIPYLLVNLVAPFRGFLDPNYAGYSFGLIELPAGILVPLVVGSIVVICFLIVSKSFTNQMDNWWTLAFGLDLLLVILVAAPLLFTILLDPGGNSIQLGEFLTLSGYVVAIIIFVLFSGPTLYALYYSGKKVFRK